VLDKKGVWVYNTKVVKNMKKMTLKNNIVNLAFSVLVLLGILAFSNVALADGNICAGSVMTVSEAESFLASGAISANVTVNGSIASAVFTNNTSCSMPIDLKSYKMYDDNINNQVFLDDTAGSVAPYSTKTLTVEVPSCKTQVDAYYGTGPIDLETEWTPNARLLGYAISSGSFCTETNNNNLVVSCNVNPSEAETGDYLNWSANATGGTGSYTYSWSGTDGLYGNVANVSKSYNDEGTKTGYITVTSGTQTVTQSCTARIDDDNNSNSNDDLDVSCYASPEDPQIGERVRWYVDVDGGDGDYDYDWNGTDGLNSSSRSPSMTYYSYGSKRATVEVESDGESETATCHANVRQNSVLAFSQPNPTPLAGAVYLSQVPYTGLADNLAVLWFVLGLALFSAYIAYVVIAYKKENA
jgi:hypothetical protein